MIDLTAPADREYARRAEALASAQFAASSCCTALSAAAVGEKDRDRRQLLAVAYSSASDLAEMLRQMRGVR